MGFHGPAPTAMLAEACWAEKQAARRSPRRAVRGQNNLIFELRFRPQGFGELTQVVVPSRSIKKKSEAEKAGLQNFALLCGSISLEISSEIIPEQPNFPNL